jgi:copper transport protein
VTWLALSPQVALAHAQLVRSDPASGARLAAVPGSVTLIFTEPVSAAGPGIRVFSPSGRQVAHAVAVHGSVLSAALNSGELGTYIVSWQVFAADTHPSRGVFAFDVGTPSSNPYASLLTATEIGTATPLGLALQALGHWIHFAGFALVFGLAGYRMLTGAAGHNRLTGAGIVLLIVAEPLAVVAQLASLSFDGDTAVGVMGSPFGRLVALRLAVALLAWTAMAGTRTWPLLAAGAADAVLDGFGAHAITGLPVVGQALLAIHVSAMGLWVGGLVGYVRAAHAGFARYAAWTFGVAAASGVVLAVAHSATFAALIDTDYGRMLIAKVIVVGVAIVTVAARRRRLELGAAAAAIAAASLLAALPPSR